MSLTQRNANTEPDIMEGEGLLLTSIERKLPGKPKKAEENGDVLTTSNIGQMVDLKWLERLQGDDTGLTEATTI